MTENVFDFDNKRRSLEYEPVEGRELENVVREIRNVRDFGPCGQDKPMENNGEMRNGKLQDLSPCGQKPQDRFHESTNRHLISEWVQQNSSQAKTDSKNCPEPLNWRTKQVQKTVDGLVDSFKTSCCGICPSRETKVPCESYRDLLKFVSQRTGSPHCTCQQTDGDYERDIIEEIQRRMDLGFCAAVSKPPPAIDFIKVPKKRPKKAPEKPPPKEKKPPKVKKSPPKPKPKPPPPPPEVYTPKVFPIEDPVEAGIIKYRLSDPEFIRKGWTQLPPSQEDTVKTFYTFQAEPCGPLLDPSVWKKKQSLRYYPDGRTMARIEPDGRVEVYYQNCGGDLAVQVSPVGERHHRVVVFFNRDEHGQDKGEELSRHDLPAAIFDSFGNGVVYDTKGKSRLVFDQAEGRLFDFPVRSKSKVEHPPLHWRWQNFQQIAQKRRLLNSNITCANIPEEFGNLKQHLPKPKIASMEELHSAKGNSGLDDKPRSKESSHKHNVSKLRIVKSKTNLAKSKTHLAKSKTHLVKSKSNINMKSKNLSRRSMKKPQSGGSSEGSKSLSTPRSSRSVSKTPLKTKRAKKPIQPELTFEFCASNLDLPDPLPRDGGSKRASDVETPIRLVMKIERGVSLVIMDQCHIHLTFQAGRKHLIFNLGVHVKPDEPLQSKDTITVDTPEVASLQDMFSVYAQTSNSLMNLLRPHHSTHRKQEILCEGAGHDSILKKQENACKGGGPGTERAGEKSCLRPLVRRQAGGPCVRRGSQKIIMECFSYEDKLDVATHREPPHGEHIEKWMRCEMDKIVDQL